MATVNFRLRSKANKNVSIKVYLSTARGNVIELNTGFSINPKDWSKDTDRPKQNSAENKIIFNNLKKLESFIFESLNKDLGESVLIDSFWLESKINECFNRIEKTDTGLLTNYIQEVIDTANTRKVKVRGGYKLGLSQSRLNSFTATKNAIKEYEEKTKKQIHFIDLNESLIDKFTSWLVDTKKYAVNTASKHIANIKTFSIEAEKKGIQVNPFAKHITVFSESDDERFIQTLSLDELELIRNADITSEALENARNWILLGCEFGQRGQDLINITKEDIRRKDGRMYLDVVQEKTKKAVTVPIIAPHAIDIIENHFPYKISTQKLNTYIKKVCEISGINEMTEGKIMDSKTGRKELKLYEKHKLITTHCFRRSFCTNYYKIMPTPVLMDISGHSKESIFLKYINRQGDKDANADLFIRLYEDMQLKREMLKETKKPEMKVIKNGTDN